VQPSDAQPLGDFLQAIARDGDDRWFLPHPLTPKEAKRIAEYSGRDVYVVGLLDDVIAAYGMLRGWDEGFETPSLGIAVLRAARRHGLGRQLMGRLHELALAAGSRRVMLHVDPENKPAIALYLRFGYELSPDGDRMVGVLDLAG
jgi:ribosomal protein S18 acetylase RimI-like enzyme